MSDSNCESPDKCSATIEQKAEMKQIKDDYRRTHKALEENTRQIAGVKMLIAETATETRAFVRQGKESSDRNDREHTKIENEQKNIHSRINTFKEAVAKEVASLKVADEANKGKTNQKLDLAEVVKMALLISAILGIFKYVLPNG